VVCAAVGNAAQTRQKMMNMVLLFIFPCVLLDKQLRDIGQRNIRRTSQGSRLLIFIGSS
jgi:hypothetical protein